MYHNATNILLLLLITYTIITMYEEKQWQLYQFILGMYYTILGMYLYVCILTRYVTVKKLPNKILRVWCWWKTVQDRNTPLIAELYTSIL